ncbi:hypothetical protein CF392_10680 [Tamilnaduibacter salinus]|uniref:Nucleotidyltransferase AbiEii toxin of type IV toxin-antitoxin system n=1 Tax=Tamilnaduibacter salinus TaxID=1484056 RepID=A0A2A2I319_9GAMM|nr:nucleotidyl transferase AbiEii/AbiGii toxin family protein [Tamilnaduibacter salinus]PAV25490.1 hypothetical protein CF392_10680 [Tamilnaduibacter salinus]
MDRSSRYYTQVQLLLRVLPFVSEETCFALKGGTAINLFVRDLPRLSVDIDLVYLPDSERDEALTDIRDALERIASATEGALHGAEVTRSYQDKADSLRLLVSSGEAVIKIELSPVLRGTVYEPQVLSVVDAVEDEFGFAEACVVAAEDLYAGKLCAALDRQHPRDWFDAMLLNENEGITSGLRKAFMVYLVSHPRPMEELLSPNWKQQDALFDGEFKGMTFRDVTLEEMRLVLEQMLSELLSTMTQNEKRFLCSVYDQEPQWELLELGGVDALPAVRWKLRNVQRMTAAKREASRERLSQILWP